MRSLLVPGWGQLHNGSWLKAIGVAAGEVTIGVQILKDERDLDRLFAAAERVRDTDNQRYNELILEYNDRVDQSTRRRWILGGIVVYALLDAYIDAHFANFGVEFENDPALPGGKPGARVRMRWAF